LSLAPHDVGGVQRPPGVRHSVPPD
jgi:hypothetical protein